MTTEFPSGEMATLEKLTELKNSSRVSLGLPSAKAGEVAARRTAEQKKYFEIFIRALGGK
jgi:hypothetical protein